MTTKATLLISPFLFPQIDPKVAFPRRAQPKVSRRIDNRISGTQRIIVARQFGFQPGNWQWKLLKLLLWGDQCVAEAQEAAPCPCRAALSGRAAAPGPVLPRPRARAAALSSVLCSWRVFGLNAGFRLVLSELSVLWLWWMGIYLCLHCWQIFFCITGEMRAELRVRLGGQVSGEAPSPGCSVRAGEQWAVSVQLAGLARAVAWGCCGQSLAWHGDGAGTQALLPCAPSKCHWVPFLLQELPVPCKCLLHFSLCLMKTN